MPTPQEIASASLASQVASFLNRGINVDRMGNVTTGNPYAFREAQRQLLAPPPPTLPPLVTHADYFPPLPPSPPPPSSPPALPPSVAKQVENLIALSPDFPPVVSAPAPPPSYFPETTYFPPNLPQAFPIADYAEENNVSSGSGTVQTADGGSARNARLERESWITGEDRRAPQRRKAKGKKRKGKR